MSAPPLFRRVRVATLALALAVGAGAGAAAFWAVVDAEERSVRSEIEADAQLMARQLDRLGPVAFGTEIELRTRGESAGPALYLLTRSDGSRVVGNLAHWPRGAALAAGWLRFDASAAGAAPGRALARTLVVSGAYPVLVGRRLAAWDALLWRFLPALGAILIASCGAAAWATRTSERHFRARIDALNAVFASVRDGGIAARERIAADARDPAELAALAAHVEAALDELQRLVRGLDAFSQTAAHELSRELTRLRDEARAGGEPRAAAAAEHAIQLLRQILALARIEADPGFAAQLLDPRALAERAIGLFEDAYDEAGVALVLEAEAGADARIRGVGELVTGALANLLENALKHSPPGAAVRVTLAANDRAVLIAVHDAGPGAASDDVAALSAAARRPGADGHGFGLRFVQAVAIRHGAQLTLRNRAPGFSVTLAFPRLDAA